MDNLAQPPALNMSYLDGAHIEDEHVRWVARDMIRNDLPFDRTLCGIDVTILIDIQPKFCTVMMSVRLEGVSGACSYCHNKGGIHRCWSGINSLGEMTGTV